MTQPKTLYAAHAALIETVLTDLVAEGVLPAGTSFANVTLEPPRDASHGDLATNAAMVLAKGAGMNPRALAEAIAAKLAAYPSITSADNKFIGVLRDGFPIYGRVDYATGTTATGLDAAGGKTGTTVDSPSTGVYHYHANAQTNGTYTIYFLTNGYYHGTAGTCTGC